MVATSWRDACYDLDDSATFTAAGSSATSLTGNTTLASSLLDCTDPTDDEAGDPWDLETFFTNQSNNQLGSNLSSSLVAPSGGSRAFISGTNEGTMTATDVSQIDPFFDATTHVGGVESEANNWTEGWTVWLND